MTDQLRINDQGEIVHEDHRPAPGEFDPWSDPRTWGESQHLFKPEAFEQIKGQLSIPPDPHSRCARCGYVPIGSKPDGWLCGKCRDLVGRFGDES